MSAQNEAANWVVTNYSQLPLHNTNIINFNSGALVVQETTVVEDHWRLLLWNPYGASISDSSGNLLFYKLDYIYNRDHKIMPGQTMNTEETAKSMIIPVPGSPDLYYVFSYTHLDRSLRYSVVDLSLDQGKGSVTETHVLFSGKYTPNFTIIRHSNQKDFWLIYRDLQDSVFKAQQITQGGLQSSPVISTPFIDLSWFDNSLPQMFYKSSPDGKKLVVGAGYNASPSLKLYLFDFDAQTGKLSNSIALHENGIVSYDFEFSPDSRKLYYGNFGDLLQVDISSGNKGQILLTKRSIKTCPGSLTLRLQLAQNGKIYTCEGGPDTSSLGVIHDPNKPGTLCGWEADIGLISKSFINFPSFVADFLQPPFSYDQSCYGIETKFLLTDSTVVSADWNFDDPGSGNNILQDSLNPVHTFTTEGDHYVRCTLYYEDGRKKMLGSSVRIRGIVHPFSLGPDTIMCKGDTLILEPCIPGLSYTWHDNTEKPSYRVTESDTIKLEITNGCDQVKDSMVVHFQDRHSVDIGPDTSLCFDRLPVLAEAPVLHGAAYIWSNGDVTRQALLKQNGVHYVDVVVGACTVRDSILLNVTPAYPFLDLGPDTVLCSGDTLILDIYNEGGEYFWQDGFDGHLIEVTDSEQIEAEVRLGSCISTDQLLVTFIETPEVDLGSDTILCAGDTLFLDATMPGAGYLWQDNSSSPVFSAYLEGNYHVMVNRGNCIATDTMHISLIDPPHPVTQKKYILCEGDTLQLNLMQKGVSYLWHNGNQDPFYSAMQADTIYVIRENQCGMARDSFYVLFEEYPWLLITGEQEACEGDTIVLRAESNEAYQWSNGSEDSMIFVTRSETYSVKASNLCGSITDSHQVNFSICCNEGNVPNLITPNGDNMNDVFYFECAKQGNWLLTIFNRYGERVYNNDNYQNDWSGGNLPDGVYFYSLNKNHKTFKGWVHLVR